MQLKTLHNIYEKIKNLFINNTINNEWLNKENENVFYSIYHYINVYGLKYSTNKIRDKDGDKSLSIIILPFIDICSNSNEKPLLKVNNNNNDIFTIYLNKTSIF